MNLITNYPHITRGPLVVWGLLAAYPFGGMTWQVLHYLVGLRRLGFDVWYVEDSDRYLYDAETFQRTTAYESNVAYLSRHLVSVGLEDRWIFRPPLTEGVCVGARDYAGLLTLYQEADAVLNLCGAQELHERHLDSRCLVFIETDPVENQVKVALGDHDKIEELDAYSYLFTYGENLGVSDCLVPVERYSWHPTRPPVVLDWWNTQGAGPTNDALTTVAKWRHVGKSVEWQGEAWHWSKHYEFLRFVDLPMWTALPLEMAVSAISDEEISGLRRSGWRTRPTSDLKDPVDYHQYICESVGEFTVAKEQYVRPRSGWFSDRSVCYLAAGRPVVTQETGFSKYIPTGEGLFSFSTMEEAVEAIDKIASDYEGHSKAALEIAREYFGVERVLSKLAAEIGLL